ncbi:MAG: hypothetical protein IJF83_13805 [Methanobrevibacter sp.]|nr:hypothetical protein [Methanobrevibacter sp.]
MDDKKIIMILVVVIVFLAVITSLVFFNPGLFDPYKEVDSNYVHTPTPNEKVKFTGTYLGPHDGAFNFDDKTGVIQVGSYYVIVSTNKLQGINEGQTVTIKGYFVNDQVEPETVPINNMYVRGESFCIEEVV